MKKKNTFPLIRIFSAFMCIFSTIVFAIFIFHPPLHAMPDKDNPVSVASGAAEDGWVVMPAGGKPAYMGIHGGTMPVSLLVSRDGTSLFSFVGRTGNDFLDALRKVYFPLPSFGNSTHSQSRPLSMPRASAAELFAGNATAIMPVIALSGDALSNAAWLKRLQPFGLSEEPLSIEGEISLPQSTTPVRKYRNLFMPDYFQPDKGTRKKSN